MDYIGRSKEEGISYEAEWDMSKHRHCVQSQNKRKEERRDLIWETKRILRVKINDVFSSFITFVHLGYKNLMC